MEEKYYQECKNKQEQIIALQMKCTFAKAMIESSEREIKELRKWETQFKTKYKVACNLKQNLKESVKNNVHMYIVYKFCFFFYWK